MVELRTQPAYVPAEGAEGVMLAAGGGTGGYVLYIKDNKFTYYYDFFGYNQYKIESSELPTGKVQVQMDFAYDGGGPGKGGTATLYVNGRKAGEGVSRRRFRHASVWTTWTSGWIRTLRSPAASTRRPTSSPAASAV